MHVTIKLFARMRDLAGVGTLAYPIEDNTTVADLLQLILADYPDLAKAANDTIVSVNRDFSDLQTVLNDGDEVAFFPPVSGGSGAGRDKFAITTEPLSLEAMQARVLRPETGAVAVFSGVVRNVSAGRDVDYLEYEAYEEMAVPKLRQVAAEAREQWPKIVDIAMVQRIGHLEVGEIAVIVAVSSPHRGDGCFEACAYAINRLKEIVPIWKKETGPDGAEWIDGDYTPTTKDAGS